MAYACAAGIIEKSGQRSDIDLEDVAGAAGKVAVPARLGEMDDRVDPRRQSADVDRPRQVGGDRSRCGAGAAAPALERKQGEPVRPPRDQLRADLRLLKETDRDSQPVPAIIGARRPSPPPRI